MKSAQPATWGLEQYILQYSVKDTYNMKTKNIKHLDLYKERKSF